MGLGFGIFDTRHVQDTSHVLENKKANNAVKHINLIIVRPFCDKLSVHFGLV